MIVFDLLCTGGHRFEGWFNSAADYASQKERHLVTCPCCGSAKVERVPSATRANLGVEPPKPPKAAIASIASHRRGLYAARPRRKSTTSSSMKASRWRATRCRLKKA